MDKGIEALIADMKAAALRATPGVWEMEGENIWYFEGGYTKHLLYAYQGDDVGDHQDDLNTRYIAAVSPANVLELIAALEQAPQEYQAIEQKLINAAVYIETLESEPRKTNLKLLNEIAGLKRKCEELQEQKDKWSAWAISLGAKADELESRPLCVKSNDAMREASIQTFVTELTRVVDAITGERLSAAKICEIRARILKCCLDKIGTPKPVKRT